MDTNTETNNHFYRSDDLLISSFLLCRQAQLVDIASDSSRHFTFTFQDPTRCKELVQEYVNGGLVVARELFSRREELLGQMRNRDRYGKNYDRTNI